MTDALELAIRADEQAKFANKRLDAVNGSIDAIKVSLENQRRESKEQFDSIMLKLSHDDGVHEGVRSSHNSFLDSKRWVISICLTLATGSLGLALFTYLLRRHT